jgi:glycosyltransferase involved in cell wall biosynthesis
MKKVKVLHIITHLPIGGAQDNTLLTVEGLNPEKYQVTLLCGPEGDWLKRLQKINYVRSIYFKSLIRPVNPMFDLIAAIQIFSHIRSEKYQIVHTHSSKPGVIGRIAARLAGATVVIHTIHGFPFHKFMPRFIYFLCVWLERFVSRLSDKIITVSNLNLEKAVQLKLAPRNRFVNIYSGIQLEKFEFKKRQFHIRQSLGLTNDHIIIGLIGRLFAQKAPQYFVKAVPEVIRHYPKTRYILVGDGELRQSLICLVKELHIQDYVQFLGFREDVPDILNILDIFVLTSLWEGLGRSLTEAMAMAKPVVATAVEGVPELVIHNKTGLLVPPCNESAIANAIIYLIRNPKKAKQMGQTAQKNVREKFSVNKMISDIDNLYESMIHVQNP